MKRLDIYRVTNLDCQSSLYIVGGASSTFSVTTAIQLESTSKWMDHTTDSTSISDYCCNTSLLCFNK